MGKVFTTDELYAIMRGEQQNQQTPQDASAAMNDRVSERNAQRRAEKLEGVQAKTAGYANGTKPTTAGSVNEGAGEEKPKSAEIDLSPKQNVTGNALYDQWREAMTGRLGKDFEARTEAPLRQAQRSVISFNGDGSFNAGQTALNAVAGMKQFKAAPRPDDTRYSDEYNKVLMDEYKAQGGTTFFGLALNAKLYNQIDEELSQKYKPVSYTKDRAEIPEHMKQEEIVQNAQSARDIANEYGAGTAYIEGSGTQKNASDFVKKYQDMSFGRKMLNTAGNAVLNYGLDFASAGLTAADALSGGRLGTGTGKVPSIYSMLNFAQNAGSGLAGEAFSSMRESSSWLGKLVLDLEHTAVEQTLDRLIGGGAGSLVPMGIRVFGSGSQEAEDEGRSIGKRVLTGAVRGGIEIATEKMSGIGGSWRGTGYGDAVFNSLDRWVAKKTNSELLGTLAQAFGGEAAEEMLSDVLNPIADRIFNLSDGDTSFFEDVWGDGQLLYDGLLGGLAGLGGGGETYLRAGATARGMGIDIATYKAAQRIAENDALRKKFEEYTGVELSDDADTAITQAAVLLTNEQASTSGVNARDIEDYAREGRRAVEEATPIQQATPAEVQNAAPTQQTAPAASAESRAPAQGAQYPQGTQEARPEAPGRTKTTREQREAAKAQAVDDFSNAQVQYYEEHGWDAALPKELETKNMSKWVKARTAAVLEENAARASREAKATPEAEEQAAIEKTGADYLAEAAGLSKGVEAPQTRTEAQGDNPAPARAQEAKQAGSDELNSALNGNDAGTKAESKVREELAPTEQAEKEKAEAKEQAWAEYEDAVRRYWRENPLANSLPKALENGTQWVEGRIDTILKRNAANSEKDRYISYIDEIEAKAPDMTERAERNKADAFSAVPRDSAIKAGQAESNRFERENVTAAAEQAPVNKADYRRGRESYYSSREEPANPRLGRQHRDEFGWKKHDPAQDEDLISAKPDYIIDPELRAAGNGIDARAAQALDMLRSGAAPSEVFNELGVVVKANGDITDGIGGNVLWRSPKKGEKNGQAGSNAENTVGGKSSGALEAGVSGDVGRGAEGVGSRAQKNARSWEELNDGERKAAREIIRRRTEVESEEADDLHLAYDSDEELIEDIYASYTEGDISLEQKWTSYFGDMGELADELNAALGGKRAASESERVYVDDYGSEYDPESGRTTRTAEEIQDERETHISDDLYYTLRAEDRLTIDNAKEWAQWQRKREEQQREQRTGVSDETAWKDAEAEYGSKSHDTIHKATQKAAEAKTFLEDEGFRNSLSDKAKEKVSGAVAEFKDKLKGLGTGHVSFSEFAEYYKSLKDSSILGDLYSERVNEQIQITRELAEEAYKDPNTYNVEKYRRAAVKSAQMASHYVGKANRVRTQLSELNSAVAANGSKRKPSEVGRTEKRGDRSRSALEKAIAKFIRWQIMPRQMFQMIDGFKFWEKGAGYRMADTIENAAAKNQTVLVEANDFFADVVNMKGYRDFATGRSRTDVKLGESTLTMAEAVSLYKIIKTMGGPSSYRVQSVDGFALKNGKDKPIMIKAEPENIRKLYDSLETAISGDEVASAYVKAFESMAEKLGKETQATAMSIDGTDSFLFGPGGYFPLTYAKTENGNFEWDKADSKDFGVPDFKNLKERTRSAGGYVSIAPVVEVTDGYIRRAADYIAFGELADTFSMMEYMHTFGMPTLTDTVEREMGSEYGSWMKNYVRDVQDLNQTRAKSRDNWWQKLNHNFQTAVLIGNPGTPFKQKGSMWLAMSELDPRAVAKAAVTSLAPGNKQIKGAKQNNPLLRFRAMGNIDASITDALQDQNTLFGRMAANSKLLKQVQSWIPKADVNEIGKIYLASCYDVQMKNPGIDVKSEEFGRKVDETFQRASMRTQSQYTMNMRDEISRGDSALLKALTMFQTQQRTTANSMLTAVEEARAAKGTEHAAKANKALRNAAAGFIASNVAYAAMNVLASSLRHKLKQFRDDDDEEQRIDPAKLAAAIGKGFAEGVGGTVLFGDTATNFVLSLATGETFYENGIGAIGAIEDAAGAIIGLTQNPTADNIRKAAGGLANIAGIPLNNAYTVLNSVAMYTADIVNAIGRSKESGDIIGELIKGTSAADIAGKRRADLYSISDASTDDILKAVDSIRKAMDKFSPDQFTYTDEDGTEVSYELTEAEKKQYREDAETAYSTGLDALLGTLGYDKLSSEAKDDVGAQIKSYARNAAERDYLDGKGLDHDTGTPVWETTVPEKDIPSYLVGKEILSASGKKAGYDAIDYLIGRFDKLQPSVQQQLKESDSLNVNKLLYADALGIGAKSWYDTKKAVEDGAEKLGETDVSKAISVYNSMKGKSDSEILNSMKTQILPESGGKLPTVIRRIEAYNKVAGNSANLGKWLNLMAELNDADENSSISKDDVYAAWSNMGLGENASYAGITRDDFYNLVKGKGGYASNEDYATQFDEVYAALVPEKVTEKARLSGTVRTAEERPTWSDRKAALEQLKRKQK